ncbi:MAG: phosphotransferase [Chthonomonadaceae bacterium]|nr:phosphotransferase [Chthonomonadaceae bacterium]
METAAQQRIVFDSLHDSAERILTDYHENTVVIERATLLTDPGRRNRIWRCELRGTGSSVPPSVIIKQVSPEGYDPAKVDAWDTSRFFRDWAGARFLSEIAPDEKHGPAFYGGDIERGFIVLEDMGEHKSLVGPLMEGNADGATEALTAFARRLGSMHASSIGKQERYRAIQRDISPLWAEAEVTSRDAAATARAKPISEFMEICKGLGLGPGEEAEQEFGAAFQRYEEPGPFQTFIHSDPCPDNVFYHAPELRLIDFEFSYFGHALHDGLYGRLPFPTCWCANTVPPEIVRKMESVYRSEFSRGCPEILDDRHFSREASVVAAYWAFNSLRWSLKDALEQDGNWGIAGTRARILSRLLMFLDTAQSADQMPALCDVYAKVCAELQRQWPEATPLPVYPAFRAIE